MSKRILGCATLLLAVIGLPGATSAQGVIVSGAVTQPLGSYADFGAQTGWMAHGGVNVPLQRGLTVLLGGFFGTNHHDQDGLTTTLTGALGGLEYHPGDPDRTHPLIYYQAGPLWRKRTGGASTTKLTYVISGGVGLAVPLTPSLQLRLTGSYLGPLFDTDYATIAIGAGLQARLGRSPPAPSR